MEEWVRDWNRQFEVAEELVPVQYLSKAVSTTGTALRRLLLEVFQWLNTTEMETTAAMCCKAWYHTSREEEFWRTRYIADFHPAETDSQGDYRRKYIAHIRASCWHCKSDLRLDQIESMSPYFNRPICYNCHYQPACRIISFAHFSKRIGMSRPAIDSLSIPSFIDNNAKSSFISLIKPKLQPYAETRRTLLLRTLDAHYPGRLQTEEREKVLAFDFGQLCLNVGWGKGPEALDKALVKFCVKWRKRENVEKGAEQFLEDIKSQ